MRSAIITLVMLLGLVGVAFAAGPAFEDVDKNGDGLISEQETKTVEGLDFGTADENDDGQLSRAEYEAASGGHEVKKLSRPGKPQPLLP